MFGWTGKILKVDLTERVVRREDISPESLREYIGGRGLAIRLLRDRFRLEPFDPEIPLIFATGPLCATKAPASPRMAIVSRSPLTGTTFDANCGGSFPLRLKGAELDAIRITGVSSSPVVLEIKGEEAELLSAKDLWGKSVNETITSLASKGSVAAIGPAGERRVLFAGIMTGDGDCSVRGGLGAVMGQKRLKAVVVRGDSAVKVADTPRFEAAANDILRLFRASPVLFGDLGFARYGTSAFVDLINQRRMTPTENFRKTFYGESSNYSGPALRKHLDFFDDGCQECPVECMKSISSGRRLPDYDTLSHFGALNDIDSLEVILDSSMLCFDLGLEPVSTAATVSAWGEWRGKFADGDEMGKLLKDIAYRRGDGDLLAEGSRRAMDALRAPHLSMNVKSLELPAYDPRGAYGLALAFCTSNRGGCHMAAMPFSHEILRKPVATDRFSFDGKARINKIAEDTIAVIDSMSVCRFAFLGATLEEFSELLTAATGIEYTQDIIRRIGERIFLTERFYNCANGFSGTDDILPERFFREPGSDGDGIKIPPINRMVFLDEMRKYYRIRGLNPNGTFAEDYLLSKP